jgi:hypothetical protein
LDTNTTLCGGLVSKIYTMKEAMEFVTRSLIESSVQTSLQLCSKKHKFKEQTTTTTHQNTTNNTLPPGHVENDPSLGYT